MKTAIISLLLILIVSQEARAQMQMPEGMQNMIEGMTGMSLERLQNATPADKQKLKEQMQKNIMDQMNLNVDPATLENMPKSEAQELVKEKFIQQMNESAFTEQQSPEDFPKWELPDAPRLKFADGSEPISAPNGVVELPQSLRDSAFIVVVADVSEQIVLHQVEAGETFAAIDLKAFPARPQDIVIELVDPQADVVAHRFRPVAAN